MRDSTAYGIGPIHNIVLAVQNEASIIVAPTMFLSTLLTIFCTFNVVL